MSLRHLSDAMRPEGAKLSIGKDHKATHSVTGPAGQTAASRNDGAHRTYVLEMAPGGHKTSLRDRRRVRKYYTSIGSSGSTSILGSWPRTRSVDTRRASIEATAASSPRSKSAAAARRHTIVTSYRRPLRPNDSVSDPSSGDETEHEPSRTEADAKERLAAARARLTSPSVVSTLTSLTCMTTQTNNSGNSSGSGSTLTQASFNRQQKAAANPSPPEGGQQEATASSSSPSSSLRGSNVPDALSFLDADSPGVTQESIQRSVAQAAAREPPNEDVSPLSTALKASLSVRSRVSSSSLAGSALSVRSEVETNEAGSREAGHTRNADHGPSDDKAPLPTSMSSNDRIAASASTPAMAAAHPATVERRHPIPRSRHRYGTPEMNWGPGNFVHSPSTSGLTPRASQVKQPPRAAEMFSMTGYELLASELSSTSATASSPRGPRVSPDTGRDGGHRQHPRITPIYRRFEALNHRLLLHLQDEVGELEEQLHRLDAADTQARRVRDGVLLPASRRAEAATGGELQWHRTDVLGKIGIKLGQYSTCFPCLVGSPPVSSSPISF